MSGHRRAAQAETATRAPSDLVVRMVADGRLTAAVVAAVLVVLALIVQLAGGGAAGVRASTDEVRTAVLACPTAPAAGAAADRLTIAAAPGAPATTKGAMRVDDLPAEEDPRLRRTAPGISRVDLSGTTVGAAVVRATGGLAPGLAAERVVAVNEGPARALSSVGCTSAAGSAWFVGASTTSGRQSRLVLTNTESTPASVDLRFWDENGPVDVPNTDEVVVAARGTRVLSLDGLAPDRRQLGVGVEVVQGQVSSALHLAEINGRGADWIEGLVRPARRLVIPGISAEATDRKLFLFAPGDSDGIVKVRMLGVDNEFAPAGADVVELRAGEVRELDLDKADPGRALTAEVTSDVPIVAAVRTIAKIGSGSEQAWAGPSAELSGPTVVPDGRAASGEKTRLLLAAPEKDAEVRVTLYSGSGAPKSRTVKIAAGRTLVLDAGRKGLERYTVVLTPSDGSGPLHVSRVLRIDAAGWTVTALETGRFTVQLPAVVPDLSAVTAERPDED